MNSVSFETGRARERSILSGLRKRYEAEGFAFVDHPTPNDLPSFLEGYVPDAVARRPDLSVAIEVKGRASRASPQKLQAIRRLFEGKNGWQFRVVYAGDDASDRPALARPQPGAIAEELREATALSNAGHHRAAFVLAWGLLEAALNDHGTEEAAKPRGAASVLQNLAMAGLIRPETERRVHPLVDLRNRVVHGDLTANVRGEDVRAVIDAVQEAVEPISA